MVTFISALSIAMIKYSSLEILLLSLLFIGIFNLLIYVFIVVKSGIEGTFPLACPLVKFPLRFVYMTNESLP